MIFPILLQIIKLGLDMNSFNSPLTFLFKKKENRNLNPVHVSFKNVLLKVLLLFFKLLFDAKVVFYRHSPLLILNQRLAKA